MTEIPMIERVARALDAGGHFGSSLAFTEPKPSDTGTILFFLRKYDTERAIACARAAIEAMREPTAKMSASVTNILSHFDGEYGDYNVYFEDRQGDEIWAAMINEALK